MLSFLKNVFRTPSIRSAVLAVGKFDDINILHLIPEDGTIERMNAPSKSTFHRDGSKEQAREQIGTATVHTGDGETAWEFLDDVETRIHELQNDLTLAAPAGSVEVTQLVQDILQPAVSDVIHKREGQCSSMSSTETYPVFVIYIKRPRAGKIMGEPTSINY